MPTVIDIQEQPFGFLRAKEELPERSKNGDALWRCDCECGAKPIIPSIRLRRGQQCCGLKCPKWRELRRKAVKSKYKAVRQDWRGTWWAPRKAAKNLGVKPCTLRKWRTTCPRLTKGKGLVADRFPNGAGRDDYYYLKTGKGRFKDCGRSLDDIVLVSTESLIPDYPGKKHILDSCKRLGISRESLRKKLVDLGRKPERKDHEYGKRECHRQGKTSFRPCKRSYITDEDESAVKAQRQVTGLADTLTVKQFAGRLEVKTSDVHNVINAGFLKAEDGKVAVLYTPNNRKKASSLVRECKRIRAENADALEWAMTKVSLERPNAKREGRPPGKLRRAAEWLDKHRAEWEKERRNGDTAPQTASAAPVVENPTDARGRWLYEERTKSPRTPWKNIVSELNRIAGERGWEALATEPAAATALQRWCQDNGKEYPHS